MYDEQNKNYLTLPIFQILFFNLYFFFVVNIGYISDNGCCVTHLNLFIYIYEKLLYFKCINL